MQDGQRQRWTPRQALGIGLALAVIVAIAAWAGAALSSGGPEGAAADRASGYGAGDGEGRPDVICMRTKIDGPPGAPGKPFTRRLEQGDDTPGAEPGDHVVPAPDAGGRGEGGDHTLPAPVPGDDGPRVYGFSMRVPGDGGPHGERGCPRPGAGPALVRPSAADRAKFRRFEACLREQGVDLPSPPRRGARRRIERAELPDPEQLREAHEKCASLLPDPEGGRRR